MSDVRRESVFSTSPALGPVLALVAGAACTATTDVNMATDGVSAQPAELVGSSCHGGGGGDRGDLFENPFDKLSAHHRPIGDHAEAGVPGGTLTPSAARPAYDAPGAINSRGRLANVKRFRAGASKQGRKYFYRVAPRDPLQTIRPTADSNRDGLPFTLRMPSDVVYPSTSGDDVIILWPRDGGRGDIADLFFNFDDETSRAKIHRSFGLDGTDVGDGSDGDVGTSASRLRIPATVLRGFEINPATPLPIQHALNVTATRHSRGGAPVSAHVLGKDMVWPAYGRDGSASNAGDNRGDIPYGTRLFIRQQDRRVRDRLSPRGKTLFDVLSYYGAYVVDGQGQHEDGGGVLQLRIDQEVSPGAVNDIDEALQAILPYLYPLRNPRRHDRESEVHSNDLPYAGGGGPLPSNAAGAGSCNSAWDAPVRQ